MSPVATITTKEKRWNRIVPTLARHLYETISPRIAVTLTLRKTRYGHTVGQDSLRSVSRLFLNRVNQKSYGRHAVRRKGYRVGSIVAIGMGIYKDHPHVHMALTTPVRVPLEQFIHTVSQIVETTKGLDCQYRVSPCHDHLWVEYMLNPARHEWVAELTHLAKRPQD